MELTSPRIILQPSVPTLSFLPQTVPDEILYSPFPDPTHLFLPMKLFLLALLKTAIPLEGIELTPLAVCSIACSGLQPVSTFYSPPPP